MSDRPPAEQRLAFGSVAALYERARPSYPRAALDEALTYAALAPGEEVLEVGAGTGKATRMLAERGLRVLALEPDPEMAALARRLTVDLPVEVLETDFESWRPRSTFGLLLCAQAWHWLDTLLRWERAAQALAPGGAVAALWTFPLWERVAPRAELSRAYAEAVPEMRADFPLHPGSRAEAIAGDWEREVPSSFGGTRVALHDWTRSYSAQGYAELIQTHQDHILLAPERRAALLERVGDVIERGGGTLEMHYRTTVCLTRLADPPGEVPA